MFWRRTDPLQEVGALIVRGGDAAARLARAMAARPVLGGLTVCVGEEWAAVFGAALDGGDGAVLPRVEGAIALYEAIPRWWLPVGVAIDLPDFARDAVMAALAAEHGIRSPVVVIPRDGSDEADAYAIQGAVPFARSVLA